MSANQQSKKARGTRLGNAVRPAADNRRSNRVGSQLRKHEHHPEGNSLRDVILGGQDGLVNILGIILGVIAAGGSETVLIATGFAAAITESISMGAVGYTSSKAELDYYRAAEVQEEKEIEEDPEEEKEELRDIYAAKGFKGELLDKVVETIAANRDVWVSTMMDEELHLEPIKTSTILRTAAVVGVATLIGHMIPLAPFLILPRTPALILAIVVSGLVLFGVGVYSAKTLVGDWRTSGAQMMVIGLGAAAIGFLVGRLFGAVGA